MIIDIAIFVVVVLKMKLMFVEQALTIKM